MRTQLTIDALAVVGAVTVTAAAIGLAALGAIDVSRWLRTQANR
jgi:hypothetical protein